MVDESEIVSASDVGSLSVDPNGGIVVSAVASMTGQGTTATEVSLNQRIQDAMVAAIIEAQANGVTDVDALRAAQLDARDRVLAEGASA